MKFCISFGKFEIKYFFYCVLLVIIEMYNNFIIYDEDKVKIINDHNLLDTFCFFLGYLLNIIITWIIHLYSKEKPLKKQLKEENNHLIEYIYNNPYEESFSIKEILKFLFICLILLISDVIEHIGYKIDDNNNNNDDDKQYNDDYMFIEYLIIFLVPKLGQDAYYKHQYISFLILIIVEIIKNIYFFSTKLYHATLILFVIHFLYSIFDAIYFLYIKGLMKYKFISPDKCNFMIGIVNVPIIILLSIIVSFTPLGKPDNEFYYDNIFEVFKNFGQFNAKNLIILVSLPFVYGIYLFIVNKTIKISSGKKI